MHVKFTVFLFLSFFYLPLFAQNVAETAAHNAAETAAQNTAQNANCDTPLTDEKLKVVFKQNALNQLALEFGKIGLFVYAIELNPIDSTLVRLGAFAKYKKPGQKDLATMRLKSWVNRCSGTTIIRGNSWLADGTLIVNRYAESDLQGRGLQWGDPDAPMRFIVYVDSRCPHCHRLIAYAKKLVEQGKVLVDVRQVSYLESTDEALQDTRLFDSKLIAGKQGSLEDAEYLDMLSGFASEDSVEDKGAAYQEAKQFIDINTKTAFDKLHIISVPGVLMQEKEHGDQYRILGYWEMNRIFQPNL